MERYLRVNLLGPGPRLMKKEFTGPRSHKGWETLPVDCVTCGHVGSNRHFWAHTVALYTESITKILTVPTFFIYFGTTAPSWPRPPYSWGFCITLSYTPHSVELLWTSDRLDAENSTCTTHSTHNRQTFMPPVGFEPTISEGERPRP